MEIVIPPKSIDNLNWDRREEEDSWSVTASMSWNEEHVNTGYYWAYGCAEV
jgi:hypothetical protein